MTILQSLRNSSDLPANTLGISLTTIRTGQSDEHLATKFQISRRILGRKLKIVRECLIKYFFSTLPGLQSH